MEAHHFFLYLPLILLGARLFAELAVRLGLPSVMGELVAGIVLGPSLLGWVSPDTAIRLMAEIGVILLLFEVGLETDLRRLLGTGGRAAAIAVAGFLAPLAGGYVLARYGFGLPELVSAFVGGTLTATSIGITVRVLADLGRQHSPEGQVVLGAAVIDDVLGVILLALLYEFSVSGAVDAGGALRVMALMAAFFALAPPAARLLAMLLRRLDGRARLPGLVPAGIVSLVLLMAWLAEGLGAPELIGGFAAGLALSRRFFLPFGAALHEATGFSERVAREMRPVLHLFTPIFFVHVGLSLDLGQIEGESAFIWSLAGALLLVAVAGKLAGALLVRDHWARRGLLGIAMVPRGEVGLVFAELGRVAGILDQAVYAALLIVIAVTTVFTPLAMKAWYARWGHLFEPVPAKRDAGPD